MRMVHFLVYTTPFLINDGHFEALKRVALIQTIRFKQ